MLCFKKLKEIRYSRDKIKRVDNPEFVHCKITVYS